MGRHSFVFNFGWVFGASFVLGFGSYFFDYFLLKFFMNDQPTIGTLTTFHSQIVFFTLGVNTAFDGNIINATISH